MIVISDTSPITNLIKINRIDLLQALYEMVIIPPEVRDEIEFLPDNRLAFSQLDWIVVKELSDRELFAELVETLDRGEAAAIVLALENNADALLIDETDGREEARRRGLEVIGLIGVLLKAKDRGYIPSVKPELDRLISDARFWIDSKLYQRALMAAGEE
jgi:predicted nucleic acid-binding protein